jgi:hypothetical protein
MTFIRKWVIQCKFYEVDVNKTDDCRLALLKSQLHKRQSNPPVVIEFPFTTTGGSVYYTVDSNCNYIVTFIGDGTITFAYDVTITEAFLVGGGNAGLTGKDDNGDNGGWGGQGGGFTILNNISVISPILSISLIVGAGGVYQVSIGSQSSFTYNNTTTSSVPNGTNWAAAQNNSGGLNNGNGSKNQAEDGYPYDGVLYGGGGGYGGDGGELKEKRR